MLVRPNTSVGTCLITAEVRSQVSEAAAPRPMWPGIEPVVPVGVAMRYSSSGDSGGAKTTMRCKSSAMSTNRWSSP